MNFSSKVCVCVWWENTDLVSTRKKRNDYYKVKQIDKDFNNNINATKILFIESLMHLFLDMKKPKLHFKRENLKLYTPEYTK